MPEIGVCHGHRGVTVCGHRQLRPGSRRGDVGGEPARAGIDPGPRPTPPSMIRSPLMLSAPIAVHGDRDGPALILASTSSGHTCGAVSKPAACSHTHESACSVPQLWPRVPRHPDMLILRPSTSSMAVTWPSGTAASSKCDAAPGASSSAAPSGLARAPKLGRRGRPGYRPGCLRGRGGRPGVVPGTTRKASCDSFVAVVAQHCPDSGPGAPVEAADQCPVLGDFGTTPAARS